VLGRAETEHRRLGGVEVVDDHVEMHLLGHLLARPSRRGIVLHLLEGDALAVLRADLGPAGRDVGLPVQHRAVERRESSRVGTVDDDAREARDGHARHGNRPAHSKPDVSPAPRRTISGSGPEKSITVVGSVPQSPESITASTAYSSCSAISQPWVMGSSWPGSSRVLETRGSPSSASSAWDTTWRGIRTPTVFFLGCCRIRGASLVAGRMNV